MKHRNVIGPQIRNLRYERGWSQEQLAAKLQLKGLDISRASLGRIENGRQAVFDYEILAFCHVFHVSEPALHPRLDPFSPDFHQKFLEFVDQNSPRRPMNACSTAQLSFEQLCSRDEQ